MYTQCPACKTVFRLHLDQLNAARGQVRCSRCHTVFHALDNIYQQAAPDTSAKTPGNATKQPDTNASESLVAMAKAAISTPQLGKSSNESEQRPSVAASAKTSRRTDKEKGRETPEASPRPKDRQIPLDEEAPPRAKSTRKKTSVAGAVKKKTAPEHTSAISRETPPASRKKPASDGSRAAPPTSSEEETLPLFGPTEAPRGSDVASGTVYQDSVEQRGESPSAEATPPLFEFNSIFEEPLFDPEVATGETQANRQDAKDKKKTPAASQPQELDLFGWDETTEKEQENTLLFHYLPEEEQPGELVPDGDQTDGSQAKPEERAQKQKTKQTKSGYTLPLEHETTRGSLKGTLLWSMGIIVMLAGLALQYLYYHRMSFAQTPSLRPLLVEMCKITACQLPPQRDLAHLELGKHLVQVHPRYKNSLLITAILVNRADFAQPFPIVEVVMTDLEQKQVARRRFLPKEYLIGRDSERLLAPMTEVPLMLEVLDPGKNAVGFEFNFY